MKTTRYRSPSVRRPNCTDFATPLIGVLCLGMTSTVAAPALSARQGSYPVPAPFDVRSPDTSSESASASIQTDPIDSGFAIVRDEALEPPFVIAYRNESFFVNDREIQPSPVGLRWGNPGDASPESRGGPTIAHIERELRNGGMVVGFADGTTRTFNRYMTQEILVVLASDAAVDAKVLSLMELGINQLGSWQWRTLIGSLVLPDSVVGRLADVQADAKEAPRHRRPSGSFRGTLSFFSFALAVLALGFTMANAPDSRHWRGHNPCPAAIRRVKLSILILILLNAYDLVATLSMLQIGEIVESNPLAAMLLDSSRQVIFFKAASLLFCASILYIARRQRIAQVAAWWVSLVYTVLLIRWSTLTCLLASATAS